MGIWEEFQKKKKEENGTGGEFNVTERYQAQLDFNNADELVLTNQQAAEKAKKYDEIISSGGYISQEDLADYRNAYDVYIDTGNRLRNVFRYQGYQFTDADEADWATQVAGLNERYDKVYGVYSPHTSEDSWKAYLAEIEQHKADLEYDTEAGRVELAGIHKQIDAAKKDIPGTDYYANILPRKYGLVRPSDAKLKVQDLEAQAKELEDRIVRAEGLQAVAELESYSDPTSQNYDPDFEEKSVYDPTKRSPKKAGGILGLTSTYDSDPYLLYAAINGDKDAIAQLQANAGSSGASSPEGNNALGGLYFSMTEGKHELVNMDEKEKKTYNYLAHEYGIAKANEYYALIRSDLFARERYADLLEMQAYTKEHPRAASVSTWLMAPLKGLSYMGQAIDYIDDGRIDENAPYNKFTYTGSDIRNTRSGMIEESWDNALGEGWGKVGSWGYQLGMSMGDFVMATAVSGGNQFMSLAIMGTGAAADTTIAAKQRGLSDDQAFALGTVAGAAEVITEKIGLDALFDVALKGKGALVYNLKNAFSEGLEEPTSSVINTLADLIISGDKAELVMKVQEYIDAGVSEGAAVGKVLGEYGLSLLGDAAGGMLSGGFMAIPGSISMSTQYRDVGAKIIKKGTASELKAAADTLGVGTNKFNLSKPGQVGQLYYTVAEKISESGKEALTGEMVKNGVSQKAATKLSGVIIDAWMGVEVDESGMDLIVAAMKDDNITGAMEVVLNGEDSPVRIAKAQLAGVMEGTEVETVAEDTAEKTPEPATEIAPETFEDVKVEDGALVDVEQEMAPEEVQGETAAENHSAVDSAIQGYISSGSVTNRTAESILADPQALDYLQKETGVLITGSAAQKRAAVKAAVTQLAKQTKKGKRTIAPKESEQKAEPQKSEQTTEKKVDMEGKTFLESSGEEVKSISVKRIGKGGAVVTVNGGTEAKLSDVSFGDERMHLAYSRVTSVEGMTAEAANKILSNPKADRFDFINEAIRAFQGGLRNESVAEKLGYDIISADEARALFKEGRKAAAAQAQAAQDLLDEIYQKAKAEVEKTGKKVNAELRYADDLDIDELLEDERGDCARLAARMVPALQGDIVLYDGPQDGKMGYYKYGEDAIYLNVNAKFDEKSMMAFVLAHEMVHRGRKGSALKYQAFADLLIEEFTKKGVSLDVLIQEQLDAAKAAKVKMTEPQAFEEVTCDACQRMLVDTNAGRILAEWGERSNQNRDFLTKLKDFLTELFDRLRKVFAGERSENRAVAAFRALDKNVQNMLAEMYVDMTKDAAEKLSVIKAAGMLDKTNTTGDGGVRYAIAGVASQTANMQSLAEAKRQLENGVSPEEIRKETGWFQGYDGMWRHEISDKDMEIDTHGRFHTNPDIRRYNELVNKVYFGDGTATDEDLQELQALKKNLQGVNMEPSTLGQLIKHDALFFAYPQLKDIVIKFADIKERGRYSPASKTITLRKDLKADPSQLGKTLVHEIQHAIQALEGFTGGSSPDYWRQVGIGEDAYQKFISNKERERARILKTLTAEERQDFFRYVQTDRLMLEALDMGNIDKAEEFEAENDNLYKKLINKEWFARLIDIQNVLEEGISEKLYTRFYESTAGEIEARDVSDRKDLSSDAIKENRPDIDRTDVVLANGSNLSYSKSAKVFFKENVFPPYNESKSDAHEWAERWSRSKDAQIQNKKLVPYHNRWYLIQAFDDMKYGYQIIERIKAKDYKKVAEYYGILTGYESLQDTSGQNAALLREARESGRTGYRFDFHATQHRGENSEIYGMGTTQNGRREANGNSSGNSRSSGEDSRRENRPSITTETDAAIGSETQQFKRWFGDWQKHPTKASKIVNADGTPRIMYHGTRVENGEFYIFDESKATKKGGLGLKALGKGNYFTAKKLDGTERYGSRVIAAYLDIKTPFVYNGGMSFREQVSNDLGIDAGSMSYDEIQTAMRNKGYDGVIQYDESGEIQIAVTFDSNQIKSVENIGTFDGGNPDIRYSLAKGGIGARTALVDALEGLARRDEEKRLLNTYRTYIKNAQADQERLVKTRKEIARLRKEGDPNERIPKLQQAVKTIQARLDRNDSALLELEGMEILKGIMDRAVREQRQMGEAQRRQMSEQYRADRADAVALQKATDADLRAMEQEFLRLMREYEKQGAKRSQLEGALAGKTADYQVMEKEFLRLMRAYEKESAKRVGLEADVAELGEDLESKKQENRDLRENQKLWEAEFRRLMTAYDRADRKVDRLEEQIQQMRDSRRRASERRKASEVRGKIKRLKARMQSTLLNPSEKSFVPVSLFETMVSVLELVDDSTEQYKRNGTLNQAQAAREATASRLNKLSRLYSEFKGTDGYQGEFDEYVDSYLRELADKYEGRNLAEMGLEELEEMYEILKSIQDVIMDARNLIGMNERYDVYEATDAIAAEQQAITDGRKNGKRNFVGIANDTMNNHALSPMRNIERMSGYDEDSMLVKLFRDIEKGVRKGNLFMMRAYKMFEKLTASPKYDDALYKEVTVDGKPVEYTDYKGRKFGLSKMQMMQAILSYEREQAMNNLNHIATGGFTFADLRMLRKGKLKEAISEENSHRVPAATEMVLEFIEILKDDKWCQDYMAVAREFFNHMAKDAINEASIATKHRAVATGEAYVPFETDQNFVVKEISAANDVQQTINSYGMLKDTQNNAPQPLIVTGLNNLIERHISQVGTVYGLAVPIRNFNKVWTTKTQPGVDGAPTVRGLIEGNWGVKGAKHIEQAVQDVQGPRKREQGVFADLYQKLKSNYIGATFLFNLSVVMKQLGSLFTATSMIQWRNPVSMMANLIYTATHFQEIAAEVDQYTASVWMRRQGLSDAELSTLMTEGQKTWLGKLAKKGPAWANPTKWITGMDSAVALSLWRYCKEDVAARTGLEGEALLEATAEFFDDVVENTQSMTDVLHRPEIQKNTNIFSEPFAMFKTDVYQMAGQLNVAAGRAFANPTKENKRALGKTVYSIAMSAVWGQLMTAAFAALRYKMGRYKDDEDELTWKSFLKRSLFSLGGDLAGYVFPIFGSEIVGIGEALAYGETDDFLDNMTMSNVNELYSMIIGISNAMIRGKEVSPQKWNKLIAKALQLFGVPTNNIIRLWEAIRKHAADIAEGEFFAFNEE